MALAGHRKVLAVKNKGVAKPAAVVKAEPVIIRRLVNPSWQIRQAFMGDNRYLRPKARNETPSR